MDLLHTEVALSEDHKLLMAGLPLGVSSGNIQSLVIDSKDGIENQLPFSKQEPQYPIPSLKLGSNDNPEHGIDDDLKPQGHKTIHPKILYDPKRPFLQHPKYIEYMKRQRQELGDDGRPIWSDEVEAAFQDALMHIPPMGRKKCSQRGKPFGRNMLIAEWILRATGEERLRKQVSSHIQVLDRFLKGIPEWDRLIKHDDTNIGLNEGRKFYHNSIEHMVQKRRTRGHSPYNRALQRYRTFSGDSESAWDAASFTDPLDVFHLHHMNFEMWVSFPGQPEHALHNYTRLQSGSGASVSMPLEEVVDWRLSFPHLQASIDEWPTSSHCELVLLTANFQLMDNFPPRRSKLGIGLELSFRGEARNSSTSPSSPHDLENWNSITSIYQAGEQVQEPTCEKCVVSQHGQIRPFFQSRWWASTFTSLTETRKLAEDSKDPAVIQLANDQVHSFLRNLTIMQEIWATQVGTDGNNLERRISILLWKFSGSPAGFVGTTTWQKLIAPPERFATNSPPPQNSEMGLPSLAMDTMVEGSRTPDPFNRNIHFLGHPTLSYDFYKTEDAISEDATMAFKPDQSHDLGNLSALFGLRASQEVAIDYLGNLNSDYSVSMQDHIALQSDAQGDHTNETNPLEVGHLIKEESALSNTSYDFLDHLPEAQPSPTNALGYHPLARYDMRYHQVLQEQLGIDNSGHHHNRQGGSSAQSTPKHDRPQHLLDELEKQLRNRDQRLPDASELIVDHDDSWSHSDELDEALRSALLAASTTSDLSHNHSSNTPQIAREMETPHWVSPLVFRPTLHPHHSFPGLELHRCAHDEFGSLQNPHPRGNQEFSYMSTASLGEDKATEATFHTMDAIATNLNRRQSEPDLSSYQGFGPIASPSQQIPAELEAIVREVATGGTVPPHSEALTEKSSQGYDSQPQLGLEKEGPIFTQNMTQTDGLTVESGGTFLEIKMEDIQA